MSAGILAYHYERIRFHKLSQIFIKEIFYKIWGYV